MDEEKFMELLDIYMPLVEKQDEIIHRLSKAISKQYQELAHLRNLFNCECESEAAEKKDLEQLIEKYDCMKEEV